MTLEGKRVIVVGMGRSGQAASKLLKAKGAEVLVTDMRPEGEVAAAKGELEALGIEVKAGGYDPDVFKGVSLVVLSPGVDPKEALWQGLREEGIEVVGELELASWWVSEPIIAVTGTNGKSTTTSLIGHLLRMAGKRIFVGGNIGAPLSEYVLDGERADLLVLEVSSFQLETIRGFRPHISVFLNISQDHLDRHRDFREYLLAKARIFENQREDDFAVLNRDDPRIWGLIPGIRARPIPFSRMKTQEGVFVDGDSIRWSLSGEEGEISLGGLPLMGPHNLENIMASLAVALICGVGREGIEEALRSFEPLPHRLQFVGEFRGVSFYDDSKATNPDATLRALEAFSRPVVLIAGGLNKGLDLGVLREGADRLRAIVTMGESASRLEEVLGKEVPAVRACSMDDAVRKAFLLARPGDIVLLSPACASFDMFRDYKHRGEAFQEAVRRLKG
ncbi:MAG: UDP-N-acetylmuramoyl-L-alanine--D-glutamate ligase [Deltaproteobacteria bacterium]|nr:MAG: UDP-N-acetylmuramoyl-L-alanine--D-glutamate ligase [Deltaproteobacteria bacterium]